METVMSEPSPGGQAPRHAGWWLLFGMILVLIALLLLAVF